MKLQQSDETAGSGVRQRDSATFEAEWPNPQPIVEWPRFRYLPRTIFQNLNHETIPIPANELHHVLMLSATNHTAYSILLSHQISAVKQTSIILAKNHPNRQEQTV